MKNVEFPTREIRSACFLFNGDAPESALYYAKVLFEWLCELLEQERVLQARSSEAGDRQDYWDKE